MTNGRRGPFSDARTDVDRLRLTPSTEQTRSPTYRLAYADPDFLVRAELRPVRLQLELLKPELVQQELGIDATIVVFGSTRIPQREDAEAALLAAREAAEAGDEAGERRVRIAERVLANTRYYDEARALGRLISEHEPQDGGGQKLAVITGGGPGIMEAANRGAYDVGARSVGLNIVLPLEQYPNRFITPELCFQFHYFAIRKMHFLMRAKALVAFPGGYGTLDELFETLTLVQTGKVEPVPVLLFGREFWDRIVDFQALRDEGMIAERDLDLFEFVETADEAWAKIRARYGW